MLHGSTLFSENEGEIVTKIAQIVGYKNAGKTTLMKLLIHYFSAQKMKVGTLKHHGHGGDIDLPENTDSTSYMEAGATVSGVQGEIITQLTFTDLPFEELIHIYAALPIDLLLIEGYKEADYPKIVLLRNREDLSLLTELSHITAVGAHDTCMVKYYPAFDVTKMTENIAELASYITDK